MGGSTGRYDSFIVRLTRGDGGAIQGDITHAATRETIHFRDARALIAFLLARIGPGAQVELPTPLVKDRP